MRTLLLFICMMHAIVLFGHDGHQMLLKSDTYNEHYQATTNPSFHYPGRPQSWLQWIGGFHLIFLHFPIALITLTVFSELLFRWYTDPLFDYASKFMLFTAAILSLPTALLGFAYSFSGNYEGSMASLLWMHMWLGFATAFLAIFVAFLRTYGRCRLYYVYLAVLFVLVNVTAFFGGGMTFGLYQLLPP